MFGGVYLPKNKDNSNWNDIVEIRDPEMFVVPTMHSSGYKTEITVKVGDEVKRGSLLAKPTESKGYFVYCPTSGRVVSIIDKFTPDGINCKHVVIKNDKKNTERKFPEMVDKSPRELLKRLAISGIVDAHYGGSPTYLRYSLNSIEKKYTLYVVLSNTDPYITSNEVLTIKHTAEVVQGAQYFASILSSRNIVFLLTGRAVEAKKALKKYIKKNQPQLKYEIREIPNTYPYDDVNLIMAKFKNKKNPFVEEKTGKVFVEDAITCYSFYNAVENNLPNDYRVITVSGQDIIRKGNYFVKNGTSIDYILEMVGKKEDANIHQIVYGGIMSGVCLYSTDISCGMESHALVFASAKESVTGKEMDCINCGKCVSACPMNLLPNKLDELCIAQKQYDATRYGIQDCINCGCCSFVCPSRRYLAQRIASTQDKIKKGGNK